VFASARLSASAASSGATVLIAIAEPISNPAWVEIRGISLRCQWKTCSAWPPFVGAEYITRL